MSFVLLGERALLAQRLYGTHLLQRGSDIRTVQGLLCHSDMDTIITYATLHCQCCQ